MQITSQDVLIVVDVQNDFCPGGALAVADGRLIRSLEDRGVLALLDPRIRKQRYGQTFLNSLPPYRMMATITDMESFFGMGGLGAAIITGI